MVARFGLVLMLALTVAATSDAAAPHRDRTPPTKPTVDVVGETTDLRPTFEFGARDNRTPPTQIRFRCAIDSGALAPCTRVYRPFSNLDFGRHVVSVQALDRVGNVSRLATASFVVVGEWDAALDFAPAPRQENPGHDAYGNTVWFYMYSGVRLHDPAIYQLLPQFVIFDANNQRWVTRAGFIPLVGADVTGKRMVFHPATDQFAILGWRSPYTGTVSVQLELSFPDPVAQVRSNGVIWSLDKEGTTLKTNLLTPAGPPASATTTVDVTSGEMLYLTIDDNGATDSDTTIGQFRVRTVPSG
jgi:hypothetical protein